jgi:hypothetical protein
MAWARKGPWLADRAPAARPGIERAGAHSGGEARRGDKEAEASVPVKRGVKELYVQMLRAILVNFTLFSADLALDSKTKGLPYFVRVQAKGCSASWYAASYGGKLQFPGLAFRTGFRLDSAN